MYIHHIPCCYQYRIHHNFDVTVQNNTCCDISCAYKFSVHYFSDASSSSTASGNAGGGESDSDSSYCPTSDSCESETIVKEGPVLGSIVIHPLVLLFIEPTGQSSCKEPPEALKPVCSAVWLLFLIGLSL